MKKIDFFAPAIEYMEKHSLHRLPSEEYSRYRRKHNLPNINTASVISINQISDIYHLSKEAYKKNVMPFRLGSPKGKKGTYFTLIKVPYPGNLEDFFLLDSKIFLTKEESFFPTTEIKNLFLFNLLPNLTENALVNLAISSGIFNYALKLDCSKSISSLITGYKSSFKFKFKPHNLLENVTCHHNKGQIEIDAVFLGKRNGKEKLFVIEAKATNKKSLAKHKLLYPILSLLSNNNVPNDIEIIPIYMRIEKKQNKWNFNITECFLPDPRKKDIYLNELIPLPETHVNITLQL